MDDSRQLPKAATNGHVLKYLSGMHSYSPRLETTDNMDQYRTWLSGLKNTLVNCNNETLNSTINIARVTLDGIPRELRHSTFIGQSQVLETLDDLQKALNAGEEITNKKESLSSRIEEWESTTNRQPIPLPSPGYFSLAPSPSPVSHTQSESSYDSAEFRNFAPRRQESIAIRRRYGMPPVSGGQPYPVDVENLLRGIHPKYDTPGTGGGARFQVLPLRVPRSTSAAGLAAKPLDFLPANTNRKEDDCLRQIFVSQQNLTARYQELETLVKQCAYSSQKHEELWNQKLLQESEWKDMINKKLQFILDILRPVSVTRLTLMRTSNPRSLILPQTLLSFLQMSRSSPLAFKLFSPRPFKLVSPQPTDSLPRLVKLQCKSV